MCALNDKGKISTFSFEQIIAVAASAVVALMIDDMIESDGKKLLVKRPLLIIMLRHTACIIEDQEYDNKRIVTGA